MNQDKRLTQTSSHRAEQSKSRRGISTILDATEARLRLGCTRKTLIYLMRRGLSPAYRTPQGLYFRAEDLDTFIRFSQALADRRL